MHGSCSWFPMRRDEIEAWVAAHRDELPTDLSELSRYPIPFRKAIVWALEPSDRVVLWREHLLSFVGASNLSTEQQDLVREVIEQLPALFGDSLEGARERLKEFKGRASGLFEREEVVEIFFTLGPPEPEGGLPLPADAMPSPVR